MGDNRTTWIVKKFYQTILTSSILLTILSCSTPQQADMVIFNGRIYTVDPSQPVVEAVAVAGGRIVHTGLWTDTKKWVGDSTHVLDLGGKTMTPGLIEGHAHMMGIGKNLLDLDLSGTKSYDEILQMVASKAKNLKPGEWVLGRGWHQDKWEEHPESMIGGFPSHHRLSEVSPNNPVFLSHASGHAALVNVKAMELAGLNADSKPPKGGEILKDFSGKPTGLLNETAQSLVAAIVPQDSPDRNKKALKLALDECLKNGITTFHDAGVDSTGIDLFKSLASKNELGVRLYIMLNGGNKNLIKAYVQHGPEIDLGNNFLTIRAIKLYADGALGSRGALLLDDYHDDPGMTGLRVQPLDYIREISLLGHSAGFQMCTHCIGDRANREILDLYEEIYTADSLKGSELRYRIEHAQHIAAQDIPRFGQLGVIPSMQAIHMSSDRPWAINRLGKKRIDEGAYVWNKLADTGAIVMNGTDAPVEPLNPIACFYASVSRQTLAGTPSGGYEPSQKMTRLEALKSYTINNAYGAFEEKMKGTIEVGKLADFTIFSQDIMEVPLQQLLKTQVEYTIVDGKIGFQRRMGNK